MGLGCRCAMEHEDTAHRIGYAAMQCRWGRWGIPKGWGTWGAAQHGRR